MMHSLKGNKVYIFLLIVASLIYLLPNIIIISQDEESFRFSTLQTILFYKELASGKYPFWMSCCGFGMQFHLIDVAVFHPVSFLFLILPPDVVLKLSYIANLLIGILSFFYLCLEIGIKRQIAFICAITYLLSASTINYVYTDFWPPMVIWWTSLPLFFLLIIRLVNSETRDHKLFYSIALGLVAGLAILNGHISKTPIYFSSLLIFTLANWKQSIKYVPWFVLSTITLILVSSITIYTVIYEFLPLYKVNEVTAIFHEYQLGLKDIWSIFLRPIPLNYFPSSFGEGIRTPSRIISFGGPFAVMAIVGAMAPGITNRYRIPFSVVLVTSLILLNTPEELNLNLLTWFFIYRDPLTVVAILLAGIALTHYYRKGSNTIRSAIIVICVVQLMAVGFGWYKFWDRYMGVSQSYLAGNPERVVQNIFEETEFKKSLIELNAKDEGRFYFSPLVDEKAKFGRMLPDGVTSNTLAMDGVRVVNTYFTFVTFRNIYPHQIGAIYAQKSVLINKPLLNVLGIKYILAKDGEKVHKDLEHVKTIHTALDEVIFVYKNKSAWEEAVTFNPEIRSFKLPKLKGCEHDKLLCADMTGVERLRDYEDNPTIRRKHGDIFLELGKHDNSKYVVVMELYRDSWRATYYNQAGVKTVLPVDEVLEGMIGLEIPKGVTEVKLEYQPGDIAFFSALSWLMIFGSSIFLIKQMVTRNY